MSLSAALALLGAASCVKSPRRSLEMQREGSVAMNGPSAWQLGLGLGLG